MASSTNYVCDKCGGYWSSKLPYTRCRYCHHKSIWQFSKTIKALEHAAHIKERRRNGEAISPDKEKAGS